MKCKKCNGEGFHKYSQETNIENIGWMDDGVPMEIIDKLSYLVENHHPLNNRRRSDPSITFIIEADSEARKEEIRLLKKIHLLS